MASRKEVTEKLLRVRTERTNLGTHYSIVFGFPPIEDSLEFIRAALKANATDYRATHSLRELIKYVPIAIVACMENFYRNAVQELIDHGDPYAARATKLIQNADVKPDYEILLAIQGRRFTLGEFVSHTMPLSSLEGINRVLAGLLDQDFLSLVKKVDLESKLWERTHLTIRRLEDKAPEIFDGVKRTIELRNAFAHEPPDLLSPDDDLINEIAEGFESTKLFLIAADVYFFRLLHAGEPEAPTQSEMNQYASMKFHEAEAKLEEQLKIYKEFLDPPEVQRLNEFQRYWREFADKRAKLLAHWPDGGTIMPTVIASELKSFTETRIEEVERAIDQERRLRMPLRKPYSTHRKK